MPPTRLARERLTHVLWGLLWLGFLTSLWLEYVHWATYYRPSADSFCTVGASFDCTAVAGSRWSVFLGVPWAVWGAVGYATMLWAAFKRSVLLVPLAVVAALVSLLLLGVSLFVVGSLCLLCEIAHVTSFFVLGLVLRQRSALYGGRRLASPHALERMSVVRGALAELDVLLAPLGLALAMIIFFPSYWDAFSFKGEPPFAVGVTEEGYPWIGSSEPKVTLHEFVDYSCEHCKVHSAHTLRALGRHPEVRVVRRQQPRMRCQESSPRSCGYVRLAYCAEEQGKFWQADRWLFAHARPGRFEPDVSGMARDLKLDEVALGECVVDPRTYERAAREARLSNKAKVRSVPAYMIDGKRVKAEEVAKLLD